MMKMRNLRITMAMLHILAESCMKKGGVPSWVSIGRGGVGDLRGFGGRGSALANRGMCAESNRFNLERDDAMNHR